MGLLRDSYTIWEKEMEVWAKSPLVNLLRAFIMPVFWLVLFGYAFGGTVTNVPVAVVMEDTGHYSQLFVQSITNGNMIVVTANTNYQHALDLLHNQQVTAVILIPPDFSDNVASGNAASVQVSIDSTTPLLAGSVTSALSAGQQAFAKSIAAENGNAKMQVPAPTLDIQQDVLYGRGMKYIDFMAAGIVVQVMVFSALFAGGMGLILDRELGTLKMVMAAPVDKMAVVIGKITAGVVQSLVSGAIALGVAVLIGVNIQTGLLGLVMVFIVLALVAFGFIGLTIVMAARIKTLQNFMMAMQTLVMPLWFLSGALYPLQTIPDWLKPLTAINPLTYATDAVRSLMLRGIIWPTFTADLIVLVLFSGAMVVLGSVVFKRTLE